MKSRVYVALPVIVAALVASHSFGQDKPGSTAGDKQLRIAGIIFQDDQFFRLMSFGMKDAAAKAGAEFILGNSMNKPDKEIQLVDSYLARKVDAIVMSPISQKSSAAAVKRAVSAGVKVVLTNSGVEGCQPTSVVEADQIELGALSGASARKYIQEKLGGKAKVAILAYKSQLAEQSDQRTRGFRQEIEKLPGVTVVTEQDAWLTEQSVKKTGDILTAHPDVNVIWSANEGGTVGAVIGVKNAGKAGKVAVYGSAASKQLLDFLESSDNILQGLATQKPFEMGQMGVELAIKGVRGESVPPKVVMKNQSLSRSDPDGVKAYRKYLEDVTAKGETR